MDKLSHFDEHGVGRMVDVGDKEITQRLARASAIIRMERGTLACIRDRKLTKGDVLDVAVVAGIMAAKHTADLIPLCHPLPLDAVSVTFDFLDDRSLALQSQVRVTGRTGAEMEALVAVSVAALTVYDMCKSIDRAMTIEKIRLEEKSGGKSGHFVRKEDAGEPNCKSP